MPCVPTQAVRWQVSDVGYIASNIAGMSLHLHAGVHAPGCLEVTERNIIYPPDPCSLDHDIYDKCLPDSGARVITQVSELNATH
jgi:hypothetical protein